MGNCGAKPAAGGGGQARKPPAGGGGPAKQKQKPSVGTGGHTKKIGKGGFAAISAGISNLEKHIDANWNPGTMDALENGTTLITNDNASGLKLEKPIGKGNYGIVYAGRYKDQRVAVKEIIIPENDAAETAYVVEDFKNEVEVCMLLDHTCLVKTLGFTTKPRLTVIQELVDNGSLYDMFTKHSFRTTPKQQISMTLEMALGVQYLHAWKPPIIHRDLKSLNLLVTADFHIKITDFGMARAKAVSSGKDFMTEVMTECGTPYWSAPELFQGKIYNEKVDQYAFAMTALEIITGRVPWKQSHNEVMNLVTDGKRPTIPAATNNALREVIEVCWDGDPKQRPAMAKVVAALKGAKV